MPKGNKVDLEELEEEILDEPEDNSDGEELDEPEDNSDGEELDEPEDSSDGEELDEPEDNSDGEELDEPEDSSGEFTLSIGGEEIPNNEEEETGLVKHLRKSHKELQKELKRLKQENESLKAPGEKPRELGPEPTLSDYDWDETEFKKALSEWNYLKLEQDRKKAELEQKLKDEETAWNNRIAEYNSMKKNLPVQDFESVEESVAEKLSAEQRGIIIHGASDPAKVMFALFKSSTHLNKLAEITDPIKFSFAVAALEKDTKMELKQKKPAKPETRVKGSGVAKIGDSMLEKLRREAEKTNDYTKVNAYKRKKRNQS